MKKLDLQILIICAALVIGATAAHAQASRTWVSGVGNDSNPCSRTAPCKTFAGAMPKTVEGGEIDALDPAGYGTVIITKAITLDGGTGTGWASILPSGVAGVTVNVTGGAHVNDAVVILRNITFNGIVQAPSVPGTNAIDYIKAAQLMVESCFFENFSRPGITEASGATAMNLRVDDCNFDNIPTGIIVNTSNGASVAEIDNCRFNGIDDGVNATSNAFVTVRNCFFAGATNGVLAKTGCQVNVVNSVFSNNTAGANLSGGGTIRLSNNDFFNNTNAISGGTAASATNNRFGGNTNNGNVTTTGIVVQ
jgi:Periplasmic copper-binding protein (NosD)